jgi:hypothetical protein
MRNWRMGFALLGALGLSSVSYAFDTGHHSDLTREAMSEFRMSEDAIQTAQIENWLVDYYTNQPTIRLGSDLEKLHFDRLTTTDQVRNYWGHLTVNTKSAIEGATRARNPTKVVALIGMSLHAVQDFYTHSNWVETQRPVADSTNYLTRTWFDAPPLIGATAPVTGDYPNHTPIARTDHGTYTTGMNHDSYVRPRWDEAYVYAYSASRQWIAAIEQWVNAIDPAMWILVRNFALTRTDRQALQTDLLAAYRVSEWVATPGNNGHWKGSGSGNVGEWAGFLRLWTDSIDSIFVEHFKNQRWHQLLTGGLTGATAPIGTVPTVPSQRFQKKAVRVRTTLVEELSVGALEARIDVGGSPDFLARITIENQTFIETMQLDRTSIAPSWWTIKFVDRSLARTNIRYELFDEDNNGDEVCDINPSSSKQRLDFSLSLFFGGGSVSGDISGSGGSSIVSQGAAPNGARAKVRLVIDFCEMM